MGLDVMVMPLSRFLSGDYQGPLESILGAGAVTRLGAEKPSETPGTSSEIVAGVRRLVSQAAGKEVDWNEAGETVWSAQYDYLPYAYLRAFAASLEYPDVEPQRPGCLGVFRSTPDGISPRTFAHVQGFLLHPFKKRPPRRVTGKLPPGSPRAFNDEEAPYDHPSFIRVCEGEPTRFPHLIHHSDNAGFWVPADFAEPIVLDPERFYVAGSSTRLLAELDEVNRHLGMARDWGQLRSGERASEEGSPLPTVRYAWSILHTAARISVERRTPIVFDG